MHEKITYSKHTAAICAVYILGNAVIGLPAENANEFTLIGFFASAILLLIAQILLSAFCAFFAGDVLRYSLSKKIISAVFLAATAVFALFIAASTFCKFTYFVSKVVLPKNSDFFVVIIFGSTIIYFCSRRQENVLKFSLVSFVFIVGIIAYFFFASFPNFNFRNLLIFQLPSIKEICTQAKPYIKNPFLASFILPVYCIFCFGERRTRDGFFGVLAGEVLLGVCVATSVLLFGATLAGRLEFPYSSALSTVTVGRLFTRLDGFSYYVYFACSLVRITVCNFVALNCLKKINILTGGKSSTPHPGRVDD
jgi:hypothetical protein